MKKLLKILVPVAEIIVFALVVLVAVIFVPSLDKKIADWFQRPLTPLEERSDIIMINVDDASINQIGVWPFGRDVYADSMDVLKDFPTEAVVYDLSFLDKSQRKVDEVYLAEDLPGIIDEAFTYLNSGDIGIPEAQEAVNEAVSATVRDVDDILADSIQFFGDAYLTLTLDDAYPLENKEQSDYILNYISLKNVVNDGDTLTYDYSGVMPAIHSFMTRAHSAGFVNAPPDKDGYLRRLPILLKYEGQYFGQLVLVPILRRFGNPEIHVSNSHVVLKDCLMDDGSRKDIKIPRDENGMLIVKYPPKKYTEYNSISLWNIYRLSLLDHNLFRSIMSMNESGLFGLWDGEDPVSYYEQARHIKEYLCTNPEDEENGFTRKNYAYLRSKFYETVKLFLNSNQDELLIAEYGEADYINEIFTNMRELFHEVETSRDEVAMKVSNAICIIGTNATSTTDFGLNQYQQAFPNPGVHYTMANQILSQDFVDDSPWWISVAIAAVLCFAYSLIAVKIKSTVRQILFGMFVVLATLFALFAYFYITKQYIGVVVPVASLIFSFAITTVINFLLTSSEKKFITSAFSQCLSKEVVNDIVANPSSFKLGGQTLEMTAMFTDIQKFSGFSELLTAGQLVALLNYYLTKMSDIIMNERGTVDKYEGDAIIALVGAPVPMPDHAARACAAAIKMKKSEVLMNQEIRSIVTQPKPDSMDDELYEAFKILVEHDREIFTRIGLNSGEMVAGYMGSENKKNYTMMGNNVNLASRLEGVNKQYSTGGIMISEATCKMLGDRFVVRSLDRVRVVNVNTPIRLYELIDEKSLASEFTLKYTEFWEKVMALFESKKYAEALEGFKKLSEKNPKDKVAKYYISLIEKFFINGTYPQEKDDFGVAYNPEDGVFKLLQK